MGPRILTPRQRRLSLGTAIVGAVLPVVIVALADYEDAPATFLVGAALAAAAPLGSILAPPDRWWVRWPFAFGGLPALTLLQANTGGVSSPYAILLVMGMVWFGLMASDRELVAGLAVTIGCCFLPMLVIGAPAYPVEPARALALALVNCSVMVGMAATTRETMRLTNRLQHAATHDRLTDLLNRRGWDDVVDSTLGSAGRGRSAVFGLVDLDQLKLANDTMGHDHGDRLLAETAQRLRRAFADDVTVARLGGDEFAILCLDGRPEDLVAALDRARADAGVDGQFSAGVAAVTPGESGSEALRRADLALYEAKSTGRNRTCVASGPLQEALESLPLDLH